MINDIFKNLILNLKGRMAFDDVIWTNTSSTTQYRLLLDTKSIVIDKWNTDDDRNFVRLDIIGQYGEILHRLMYVKMIEPDDYDELEKFYNEVDIYYKNQSQRIVNDLIIEINKLGKIGKLDTEIKPKKLTTI